jgi:hypothetical protein
LTKILISSLLINEVKFKLNNSSEDQEEKVRNKLLFFFI